MKHSHCVVTWLLFFSLATFFLPSPLQAEDWYRYRGPNLNGISLETEWSHEWPDTGPQVLWKVEVGTGFSSVSIRNGKLYTIGNEENVDTIHCLDTETGKTVWTHSYSSPTDPNEFEGGPTSTPTVDEKVVFTLSRSGDVFALDADTGDSLWSTNVAIDAEVRQPAWGFAGSPLVVGDLLILNVGDAGVAVDKRTGMLVWKSGDKDAGYSSMVPVDHDGATCVIFGSARSYVCVQALSGKEVWRQRWLTTFGCNASDPIIDGRRVFLSSGYNRGSALLDASDSPPKVVWKTKAFQNQLTSSVKIGDFIYGANGDVASGAKLACLNIATGELAWSEEEVHVGGLTAAGDRLIVLTDSGKLVIAHANSDHFETLAQCDVMAGKCWTAPVLCNQRIYCRNSEGQIVCLDVGP